MKFIILMVLLLFITGCVDEVYASNGNYVGSRGTGIHETGNQRVHKHAWKRIRPEHESGIPGLNSSVNWLG